MKSSLVVLLALASTALAGPAPNLGVAKLPKIERAKSTAPLDATWKTFKSNGGTIGDEFSVELPGVPTESVFKIGQQDATRLDLTVAPDVAYSIAYLTLRDPFPEIEDELDAAMATAVTSSGGKLDGKVKELDVKGNAARDARIKLNNGAVVAIRIVLANQTMYELAAGDASRTSADKLFASFSVVAMAGLIGSRADDGCGTSSSTGTIGGVDGSGRIKAASVEGGLDSATVRRCIHVYFSMVRTCYGDALFRHPGISGAIVAKFTIALDGTVSSSKATGFNAGVARCIADAIRTLQFPKPKTKTVAATYTFAFMPPRR